MDADFIAKSFQKAVAAKEKEKTDKKKEGQRKRTGKSFLSLSILSSIFLAART